MTITPQQFDQEIEGIKDQLSKMGLTPEQAKRQFFRNSVAPSLKGQPMDARAKALEDWGIARKNQAPSFNPIGDAAAGAQKTLVGQIGRGAAKGMGKNLGDIDGVTGPTGFLGQVVSPAIETAAQFVGDVITLGAAGKAVRKIPGVGVALDAAAERAGAALGPSLADLGKVKIAGKSIGDLTPYFQGAIQHGVPMAAINAGGTAATGGSPKDIVTAGLMGLMIPQKGRVFHEAPVPAEPNGINLLRDIKKTAYEPIPSKSAAEAKTVTFEAPDFGLPKESYQAVSDALPSVEVKGNAPAIETLSDSDLQTAIKRSTEIGSSEAIDVLSNEAKRRGLPLPSMPVPDDFRSQFDQSVSARSRDSKTQGYDQMFRAIDERNSHPANVSPEVIDRSLNINTPRPLTDFETLNRESDFRKLFSQAEQQQPRANDVRQFKGGDPVVEQVNSRPVFDPLARPNDVRDFYGGDTSLDRAVNRPVTDPRSRPEDVRPFVGGNETIEARARRVLTERGKTPDQVELIIKKAKTKRPELFGVDPEIERMYRVIEQHGTAQGDEQRRPFAITEDPKSINEKTWYHGTGNKGLTADSLDPNFTKNEGLFGSGVYLTDSPEIAKGYASSRGKRTGTPTIYEAKVNIGNVLNLEKPADPKFLGIVQDQAEAIARRYGDESIVDGVKGAASRPGATNQDVYHAFSKGIEDLSQGERIPASEFVEDFQDLGGNLKEQGIDAYTHTGGKRTSKPPHQVLVVLDPNDHLGNTGRTGQITKFNNLLTDESGEHDPAAMAEGVSRIGKSIHDFSDKALKTSIEASKQLHPVIGGALQKMAAARSESAYLADKWNRYVTQGLNDQQSRLFGRFLVHEKGNAIERRDGTPNNMPRLNPKELAYVNSDPQIQAAIQRHIEIQPHIAAMRRYLGGTTDTLNTESGTTIRSKFLQEGDRAVHGFDSQGNLLPKGEVRWTGGNGGSVAARSRIKGTDTHRATGMHEAYETDYHTLLRHSLDQDFFNMRRKQFLETMQKEGFAAPIEKGQSRPPTMIVNGKEVPTATIEFRAPGIETVNEQTGEVLHNGPTVNSYAVPKQFEMDYNHLTQARQNDLPGGAPKWWQKTAGLATKVQLMVPAEATKHAARVITLLSKNPMAKDKMGYAMKYLVPYFGPRLEAVRQIMDVSAADRPLMDRLASSGAIPLRTIEHFQGKTGFGWEDTLSNAIDKIPGIEKVKKVAELPKNAVFGMADPDATGMGRLFGIDVRSRVAAAKLYLKVKPKATDAELADYANQFGNYTTELQSRAVRRLKDWGFTFFGFQSQAIPTELARMVGKHGMDASHLSPEKQLALTAGTLVSGTLGTAAMNCLITYALTKKWPWEHAGLKPGDVRISDTGPDERPIDIDFSSFDPALARSMRFTGLRAALVAAHEGGDLADKMGIFAKEVKRDAINNGLSMTGPAIHDAARLAGTELFINRKDSLQRTVPDYQDLSKQIPANLGMALLKSNGVVDQAANAILPYMGKTIADNPRYPKDPNWNAGMRAWDTFSPVNIISGKEDSMAEAQNIMRQFKRLKDRYKAAAE